MLAARTVVGSDCVFYVGLFLQVKAGRGDRLKPDAAAKWAKKLAHDSGDTEWAMYEGAGLFDGSYHLGPQGVAFGLADRVGELHNVLREVYGELPLAAYKVRPFPFPFLGGMGIDAAASVAGQALASGIVDATAERMQAEELWAKYDVRC